MAIAGSNTVGAGVNKAGAAVGTQDARRVQVHANTTCRDQASVHKEDNAGEGLGEWTDGARAIPRGARA